MSDWEKQRRHKRVPFAFDVELGGAPGRPGHCQRIAAAGLVVYTPHVLPAGEEIDLAFSLPDQALTRISVTGRVLQTHVEDTAARTLGSMKVLFLGLDAHDEEAIRSFVLRCIRREAEYSQVASVVPDERRIFAARFFGTETDTDSYVVDISEGGLYVRTLKLPQRGEMVHADLYIPGAGVVTRVGATVMWIRDHDANEPGKAGCGLQFGALPDDARSLIREFVEMFGE